MGKQIVHDDVADGVGGFERTQVTLVPGDALGGDALLGGHAAGLAVVIAYGAEGDHAMTVDAAGVRQVLKRLERAAIFYGCCDKLTLAAGEAGQPPDGPGVEELAAPVARGGQFIPMVTKGGGAVAAPSKLLRISLRCSESARGVERVSGKAHAASVSLRVRTGRQAQQRDLQRARTSAAGDNR